MSNVQMLSDLNASLLAEAFPAKYRQLAMVAAEDVTHSLASRQYTKRFAVQVDGETVLIPTRLRFASIELDLPNRDAEWPLARALQTRSSDGYERQQAARNLLKSPQAWAAPFIVALIGEYVVEILDDILSALTPELEQVLGHFVACNGAFWNTTKCRVTSYWNAYHRSGKTNSCRLVYSREEYVGFVLVEKLQTAASRLTKASGGDNQRNGVY